MFVPVLLNAQYIYPGSRLFARGQG